MAVNYWMYSLTVWSLNHLNKLNEYDTEVRSNTCDTCTLSKIKRDSVYAAQLMLT